LNRFLATLNRWVSAPEPAAGRSTGEDERRAWARYQPEVPVRLRLARVGDREALDAEVLDVSLGGVRLRAARPFEPGALLSIELPAAPCPARVLAYVIHSQAEEGGRWALGCSFAAELADDDLRALGAQRQRPQAPDQRQWVRFSCPIKASWAPLRSSPGDSFPARVLDISPSGVGLVVGEEVEVGTVLSLTLHGSAGGLTILASVVRAAAQGEAEWALGCSFIRELADAELGALLASA
jgi:hypothetical protein